MIEMSGTIANYVKFQKYSFLNVILTLENQILKDILGSPNQRHLTRRIWKVWHSIQYTALSRTSQN